MAEMATYVLFMVHANTDDTDDDDTLIFYSIEPKEEPDVVALQVVVHKSTSRLILATGVTVHLFSGDVKIAMISWIISFRK